MPSVSAVQAAVAKGRARRTQAASLRLSSRAAAAWSPFTHRNRLSRTQINPVQSLRGGQSVDRKDQDDQEFSETSRVIR